MLPNFITNPNSDIAQVIFCHPSTIYNAQTLNSVMVRPAQGERVNLINIKREKQYRIKEYRYNGSGNEINQVEITLDDMNSWLYCVRKINYPLQLCLISPVYSSHWTSMDSTPRRLFSMAKSSGPGCTGTLI